MPDLSFENIDAGRGFDWGRTSADYDRYRPGPPDSFYERLAALEIGLPGQRILDLGTGTGLLARRFAAQGAQVTGIDVAEAQIAMARAAAERENVTIEFLEAPAEALPFADDGFDVVTANQCWLYFDLAKTIPEALRVLAPGGRLLVSHFSFMPRLDAVVAASEALVLEYNPDWSGADWDGVLPEEPRWSQRDFDLVGLFVYDEQIPFTRESWRGRMRALRGIAATLSQDDVDRFDQEHEELLAGLVPDEFEVCHRIHAHIFAPKTLAQT
jgi:SAM-dependent methyltransferase